VRSVLSPEQLHLEIESYLAGLEEAFIFGTGTAGMDVVVETSSVIFDQHKIMKNDAPLASQA
jgi:hypothetical protein